MIVELEGLEVFGRHGVLDEERRDGQTFLYDVRLEVGDAARSTGSRMPSTTATSPIACARSRTAGSST